MPTLYILGGANGVGKTTFFENSIVQNFININLPFINTDNIVKEKFGSYTTENYLRAEQIVRNSIEELIADEKDFLLESNLAKQSDFDWIQLMRKKGYQIILFFLCTGNVEINIKRVEQRVLEGGHNVPESIIRQRYVMSLLYLRKEILLFEEFYLYQNNEETATLIVKLIKGKTEFSLNYLPKWAEHLLFIANKLHP
jgi:predicted ABC-type ATPase